MVGVPGVHGGFVELDVVGEVVALESVGVVAAREWSALLLEDQRLQLPAVLSVDGLV